jgi:hypothetical protein
MRISHCEKGSEANWQIWQRSCYNFKIMGEILILSVTLILASVFSFAQRKVTHLMTLPQRFMTINLFDQKKCLQARINI